MSHLIEYLQANPRVAAIIAVVAILLGFLIYAVVVNAHEERERIKRLERELGPKLAKYDTIGRKPKRELRFPSLRIRWFHRRNQPQGSS